jgi:hypothetical protein
MFVSSRAYERAIGELVSRDYEPSESFYELLIGATAAFLCGADPHTEETRVFDEFVTRHMPAIRAAIDRVKPTHPEIADAEQRWLNAGLATLAGKIPF